MWPLILLRLMTTPLALISRLQLTTFASITVPFAVMVHGPLYAVRAVPAGTPVLLASGKPVRDGGGPGSVGPPPARPGFAVALGGAEPRFAVPLGVGLAPGSSSGASELAVAVGAPAATLAGRVSAGPTMATTTPSASAPTVVNVM